MFKNHQAKALVGVAALIEMLNLIGDHDVTDHDVAEVLTKYELELRALVEEYVVINVEP
jgi:hypothetical protein